jgi:hypothetical protein
MKGFAHHRDTEVTEDYPKGKGFYFHPTGRYRLDEKVLSSRSIKSENFFLVRLPNAQNLLGLSVPPDKPKIAFLCDLCVSVVKCF